MRPSRWKSALGRFAGSAARVLSSFGGDKRGNVALILAVAAIPTLGAVGAGVDYSIAYRARTKLQEVADAAALVAVSKVEQGLSASTAQTDAQNFFNAQAAALGLAASTLTVTVTDSSSSTGRTAVVSFTGSTPTSILGVMGFSSIPFSASSTANVALPTYIDFYLLLDNTPSMGLAATQADITRLQNLTASGEEGACAFACHNTYTPGNHSQLDPTGNYYYIAKNNGVTMRIDVVRQATQALMDTASNSEVVSNQFRMAIYTFGADCSSPGLTTVQALTSSLSTAKSAAGNIDLMTIPYQNYNSDQCTDFDGTFSSMNSTIPTPGSGTSAAPQKFLFYVSDGVADANYPSSCTRPTAGGGRCQEPLTVANCTALKNRGVQIAVLYTTYQQLTGNSWYMSWIDPFNQGPFAPSPNSKIAQNMQSCASPGYYFEVGPNQGISDAMNALFKKAVAQARLTH
jgi:Flp pilus assembly protein TadG